MTETATFTVGSHYSATSACNSDCVWTFEVVKRTAKFVTLRDVRSGEVRRVGVKLSTWRNQPHEYALPFGNHSMAAVITADRPTAMAEEVAR